MGKLQITTAEIKTRILRVCHVKKTVSTLWVTWKTRILRVCHVPYTLVRVGYVSNGAASDSSYSHRSAAESWTDKEDVQPCYTPFHVLPLPRHRLAGRC